MLYNCVMRNKVLPLVALFVVVICAVGLLVYLGDDRAGENSIDSVTEVGKRPQDTRYSGVNRGNVVRKDLPASSKDAVKGEKVEVDGSGDVASAPQSEDEKRELEEEKLVEDFDSLTDKWMEPSSKGVSINDIDAFAEKFRSVPKARKEECLQRALNLVPDENVMLLAGILMDKTQDKELVGLIFNDVLNRDESVKGPILQQIFKDKEHPCWADTAWILDVTGETPGRK